jgi:hypothetical protein
MDQPLTEAERLALELLPRPSSISTLHVAENPGLYANSPQSALDTISAMLSSVPASQRDAVGALLAGWARDGGGDSHWRASLRQLLGASDVREERLPIDRQTAA